MTDFRPLGDPYTYQIRSWTSKDDPLALVRFLQVVEATDHDGEDVREEILLQQVTPPGHNPEQDRWVAVSSADPTTLLGWGFVWHVPGEPMATLAGAVLPSWRHRGIGGALLTQALARAAALGAQTAGLYANTGNAGATRFAATHVFHPVSANTLLCHSGTLPLPEPELPLGYRIRRYSELGDPATLLQAMNHCYAGQWGHHQLTEDGLAAWGPQLLGGETLLLFDAADTVVGMCRVERLDEGVPSIDAPGIVPALRAHNLYAPLLLAAVAYVQERASGEGRAAIDLESWGDLDATVAQYLNLGFVIVRQAVAYERHLA